MDTAKIEQEIKKFALSRGATLVGFASVEEVNKYAPAGHRPTDFLKSARSAVVVAAGLPTAGAWASHHPRALELVGYNRTAAPAISLQVAQFIEDRFGHYSMLIPPGTPAGHIPVMSLKLLAEMAGLGTRTMAAGTILNEKYGLTYFGAAITTLPLRPTGPLSTSLCPHRLCINMWKREGTTPCLKACPECLSGELQDGRIKWLEYNQLKCFSRAQTTGTDFFQKMLLEIINEPDKERRKFLAFGPHFYRTVRAIGFSEGVVAQCFECTRPCPIGFKYRHGTMQ